jgi:zinc protease
VIRRLTSIGLFAAALLVAVASPASAIKIERVVSPGGIEAWLVREQSLPLVSLRFAFQGGANEDPNNKPGVGHMVAALLDDGAGELDAKAFQQQIEENALQLQFTTTRDYFYGTIRMLRDRQDQSIELLRLALNQPRFDGSALERGRQNITLKCLWRSSTPKSICSWKNRWRCRWGTVIAWWTAPRSRIERPRLA